MGEGSGGKGGGKWGEGGGKWGERGRDVGIGYPLSTPSLLWGNGLRSNFNIFQEHLS